MPGLQGFQHIAGVDEVGRGALFGPVFAAAVILSPDRPIRGLRDSKLLDAERREILASAHSRARHRVVRCSRATPSKSIASISCKPRAWPCAAPSKS